MVNDILTIIDRRLSLDLERAAHHGGRTLYINSHKSDNI